MDFDTVADELYGLSPEDFIPTRNARQKEAKASDNKGLAADIHRLTKPNAVAWLVNQLVREHKDGIQALLDLGSAMREATANLSGARLRDLSRQQHQVVRNLIEQAEQLSSAEGRRLSTDTARSLEETLYATLADPNAANTVAAGRLTAGLQPTGFGGLEIGGSQQPPSAATKLPSDADEQPRMKGRRGVEELERAETNVSLAKVAVERATQARDEAHARLRQAEQSLDGANDRVEQLRRELHDAVEAQGKAKTDRRQAKATFDQAERQERDAQQGLSDAGAT